MLYLSATNLIYLIFPGYVADILSPEKFAITLKRLQKSNEVGFLCGAETDTKARIVKLNNGV